MSRMRRSGRTEISVEHHESVIVRRLRSPVHAWCNDCGAQVEMVAADEAARLAHVTPRTMYRWLELAKVHYFERGDGSVLVCAPSISKLAEGSVSKPPTPGIFGRKTRLEDDIC